MTTPGQGPPVASGCATTPSKVSPAVWKETALCRTVFTPALLLAYRNHIRRGGPVWQEENHHLVLSVHARSLPLGRWHIGKVAILHQRFLNFLRQVPGVHH